MNMQNMTLSILILAISITGSATVLARGEGGYVHNFNNNNYHNQNFGNINRYNHYNNQFYYDHHVNGYVNGYNNGVVVIPGDSDPDTSCQTTQVCDLSGNCVTQQNCN